LSPKKSRWVGTGQSFTAPAVKPLINHRFANMKMATMGMERATANAMT
jgi:hypothetical protein